MFAYCLNNPVYYSDPIGKRVVADNSMMLASAGVFVFGSMLIYPPLVHGLASGVAEALIEIFFPAKTDTAFVSEEKATPQEPDVTYPGDDSSIPPGEDYEWHGKEPVGGDKGAWVNEKTNEKWHPDLNHGAPIGPHWDYTDASGTVWRIFADGTIALR